MTALLTPRTDRTRVADQSVVVLEFNELSPTLISEFIELGELPNFKRLYFESQVYVTDADEAAPNLEPWIQWVTVHSGLSFAEHGVFDLGEGHKLGRQRLWDIASDHGMAVWVCGSMNISYREPINGWILPDVWSRGCAPYPDELLPFYNFVRSQVQEHTNTRAALGKSTLIKFLRFMVSHGLSPATVVAIVKQLVEERISGKGRWKRACILDKLQWDLFRGHYRKLRPSLSTFFINSTAHLQHMHWRDMDPASFQVKPTDAQRDEYGRAILHGYKEMDKLVGDALSMVDGNTTLILSSALGQQPCALYDDFGGKVNYRPHDLREVLNFAGIPQTYRVVPNMSQQFNVEFDSEADAERAATLLSALRSEGRQTMLARQNGEAVVTGCLIHDQLSKDAMLSGSISNDPRPFFEVFYLTEGVKSGMHHPDGILWVRQPGVEPERHAGRVPLLDVAPTILHLLGIPKPTYMRGSPLSSARQPERERFQGSAVT
jgi:Type I phosphodiesterase / nucleotide pyrophosphatase